MLFFCFFSQQRLSLFTICAPQQLQWRIKCGVFVLFKKKKKATEGGTRAATACAPVLLVQFTSHKGPENIVLYVVLSFLGSYFCGCWPAPPPPFPFSPPPNITPQTFNPCHSKPLSSAPNSCSLMLFDACWNLLILLNEKMSFQAFLSASLSHPAVGSDPLQRFTVVSTVTLSHCCIWVFILIVKIKTQIQQLLN